MSYISCDTRSDNSASVLSFLVYNPQKESSKLLGVPKERNGMEWYVLVNKGVEHEIDLMMKKEEINQGPFISSSAFCDFSFDCLSMLDSKDFFINTTHVQNV